MQPPRDCALCPRLAELRARTRRAYPDYYAGAVPAIGPANARLLVVGLAPGLHGAHRTGRAFHGDASGATLFRGLAAGGFVDRRGGDARLVDCRITNAVKCLPPDNKPAIAEIRRCGDYLARELGTPEVVVALGRIAHDAILRALSLRLVDAAFGNGRQHALRARLTLLDSYHCSRYNMHTGRLTDAMLAAVFESARALLRARLS